MFRVSNLRLKADNKPRFESNNENFFIFTEIINCGKIGKVALESFSLHHPELPVHIYGTAKDFAQITKLDSYIFHDLVEDQKIVENFNKGHLGTASLWAKLIIEREERYIIHFDSDVVFRGSVFPEIINQLKAGFSLVGPRRNYQHNPNKMDNVRWLSDVSQTVCFGFDRTKITKREYSVLIKMCQGGYNPYGHPVIDFFDPVMFDILRNGGSIYFLHENDFGGCDAYGKRNMKYPELNAQIDFGNKLAHFSAVGSGMNFINNNKGITQHVSKSYIDHAIEKYAVYCKIFYNEEIPFSYNKKKYEALFNLRDWYNNAPPIEPKLFS